jgi:hypothetical protein
MLDTDCTKANVVMNDFTDRTTTNMGCYLIYGHAPIHQNQVTGMFNIVGRMRWVGHVARMGEERAVHRVLVGKPEGKRPLGRLRRRWEDNIKMDLWEVGVGCGDWIESAQDRDR